MWISIVHALVDQHDFVCNIKFFLGWYWPRGYNKDGEMTKPASTFTLGNLQNNNNMRFTTLYYCV